jgi:hypothetical protein
MRRLGLGMALLLLGALALSPVIAALGLDPLPGDVAFDLGHSHVAVPVAYSLCASMGLTLLYCVMKG